jgi:hypothetical protein
VADPRDVTDVPLRLQAGDDLAGKVDALGQEMGYAFKAAEGARAILASMTVWHIVQTLWLIGLTVAVVLR